MNSRGKVLAGLKSNSLSQFGRQLIQLTTSIVLARLLQPSDFGLIAMATIFIGFVSIFNDLGTSAAIIHKENISQDLLASVYWVNVAFGLLTMITLIIISPFIADFYKEERVTAVLGFLSVNFLISSFGIMHQALLERELAFGKLARVELIGAAFGASGGILSALLGYGVWSLVIQSIAATSLATILLWYFMPWRPHFRFHFAQVKAVSNYSLNLMSFNIFNYFARNTDNLLIGRFLGAEALGFYNLAYLIMLYPMQNISWVIGRVMFPFYSRLQNDNESFGQIYLKIASAISVITFPMMLGLMAVARPFVMSVFGSQWSPVIVLLLILSPVGMIQSIGTSVGAIYQAKGRTDLMLKYGAAISLLNVASIIIGLQWGIQGVAAAYAISTLIVTYPLNAIPLKLINLSMKNLLLVLVKPFAASVTMFVLLIIIKFFIPNTLSSIWSLLILVVCGIILYVLASLMNNRKHFFELMNTIKEGIRA